MKTSEFKAAVAEQEKIIRQASVELRKLDDRAIAELCPVQRGESIRSSDLRLMIVKTIHIITPVLNDNWAFRIRGDIIDSFDEGETVIPFPEN